MASLLQVPPSSSAAVEGPPATGISSLLCTAKKQLMNASRTAVVAVLLFAVLCFAVIAVRRTDPSQPESVVVAQQQLHQLPTPPLQGKLDALEQRVASVQEEIGGLMRQKAAIFAPTEDQQEPIWPFERQQLRFQRPLKMRRHMAWQPMRKRAPETEWQPIKRTAAWQPMKRSNYYYEMREQQNSNMDNGREEVMRAIENELIEVLQAGERLGIAPEEILAHLRTKNEFIPTK